MVDFWRILKLKCDILIGLNLFYKFMACKGVACVFNKGQVHPWEGKTLRVFPAYMCVISSGNQVVSHF